jgi:hypothetical protein
MMQTEKAGLSLKEKRLMVSAVVLGLFYLAFQFGFLPLFNDYREKTELRGDLSEQKSTVELRLSSEAAVIYGYENAKSAYLEIEGPFRLTGTSTDLSRTLTELCLRNGFSVSSQLLGNRVNFRVPREEGERTDGDSAFSTVTATMSVSGDYASVKRLLDEAEADNFISVSRISFEQDTDQELDKISVTFVVTLLNGLD